MAVGAARAFRGAASILAWAVLIVAGLLVGGIVAAVVSDAMLL
jgi:hypothetical protein